MGSITSGAGAALRGIPSISDWSAGAGGSRGADEVPGWTRTYAKLSTRSSGGVRRGLQGVAGSNTALVEAGEQWTRVPMRAREGRGQPVRMPARLAVAARVPAALRGPAGVRGAVRLSARCGGGGGTSKLRGG